MAGILRKNVGLAAAIVILLGVLMVIKLCEATKGFNKHHVIGGDQGWDSSNNIASWSSNKIFRVRDTIWFAYAAPEEGIMELKTESEFESCEPINPIKMYTEGLNQLTLEEEGSRYFISTNFKNCKNGLKLHVKVHPENQEINEAIPVAGDFTAIRVAEGPSSSHARRYTVLSLELLLFVFVYSITSLLLSRY